MIEVAGLPASTFFRQLQWEQDELSLAGRIRAGSLDLFERYKDLQDYVGWTGEDAARIKSFAHVVEQRMDALIDDFYAEIKRHPDAARVITGGEEQISRLIASLRAWLIESLQGRNDADYVSRRWNIGLRHAEIGLNPAYTAAAMSRLRNGLVDILAASRTHRSTDLLRFVQSFNKLLDLDLSIIQDAYGRSTYGGKNWRNMNAAR
jgi:hypothetical protein